MDRIQIIVCDGRSTDYTRIVVENYIKQYPRLEMIDNRGLTAPTGFNVGIKAARSDYIAILSAHSVVAPDWIEQTVSAPEKHSAEDW